MPYFDRYNKSHGVLSRPTLAFEPVNTLADGLEDDIRAEQQEQGIVLEETQDPHELSQFWEDALNEARKDPSWTFTDQENATLY